MLTGIEFLRSLPQKTLHRLCAAHGVRGGRLNADKARALEPIFSGDIEQLIRDTTKKDILIVLRKHSMQGPGSGARKPEVQEYAIDVFCRGVPPVARDNPNLVRHLVQHTDRERQRLTTTVRGLLNALAQDRGDAGDPATWRDQLFDLGDVLAGAGCHPEHPDDDFSAVDAKATIDDEVILDTSELWEHLDRYLGVSPLEWIGSANYPAQVGAPDRHPESSPSAPLFGRLPRAQGREVVSTLDAEPPAALYDYQREAARRLDEVLTGPGRAGILSLPTGAGKTKTAVTWLLAHLDRDPDARILWLANRDELIEQAIEAFREHAGLLRRRSELSIARYTAESKSLEADVVVASVPSFHLGNITHSRYCPSVICVDEAHHVPARTYRETLERLGYRDRILLGLSATPTRTAKHERSVLFKYFRDEIVHQVTYAHLMERGYLSRPILRPIETHALVAISPARAHHIRKFRDIPEDVRAELADDEARNQTIVREIVDNLDDYRPLLLFALNVEHAEEMHELLTDRGIRAAIVLGETPRAERRQIVAALKAGELDCIVNVQVLTEGVDLPNLNAVLLARPTMSETLYNQMRGRGSRGPRLGGTDSYYVVDFVDNFTEFGHCLDHRWQLPLHAPTAGAAPAPLPRQPSDPAAADTLPPHVEQQVEALRQSLRALRWEENEAVDTTEFRLHGWYDWLDGDIPRCFVLFDADLDDGLAAVRELEALQAVAQPSYMDQARDIFRKFLWESLASLASWEAFAQHVRKTRSIPEFRLWNPPDLDLAEIARHVQTMDIWSGEDYLQSQYRRVQSDYSSFDSFKRAVRDCLES